ncbi:MAG: hypothetical protein AMXMBFR53_43470 [Gemmatimonadota bacterium]
MRRHPVLTALVAAALAQGAGAAAAQDVELLSRIHGTPLPPGYFRTREAIPGAFEFTRGRAVRLRERVRASAPAGAPGEGVTPMAVLGPREGPVEGTFPVPVLLGLFADSPASSIPFPMAQIQTAYFGDGPGTITAYYREASGDRVTLAGQLHDWIRSTVTKAQATGGQSGLSVGTTGSFILDLLRQMPTGTNWGLYDNDGPDGLPNSGDDDGFVDVLAVLHPTPGAECGTTDRNNRIWSHRWSLRFSARQTFVTATPAANGGFVQVDDYVVQPAYNCAGTALNEIGVFTHELGHAFGLPDLYDTNTGDGKHAGAGNWELMATGSYGCDGQSPELPCHMSAWSKMVLGWVDVETLPLDTDLGTLTLPPVETTGTVYRVDAADDSGEYYLLENRQRVGFDARVPEEGMLVWRIHQPILDAQWRFNSVNAFAQLGVWLREADGLNELARPDCGRGNAGDPFPFEGSLRGCKGVTVEGENRVFHAGSNPSSMTDVGEASGLTLLDIRRTGDDIAFRVSTRFTRIAVRSEGDDGRGGLFRLNGAAVADPGFTFRSAPFLGQTLEAAAGESLGPGVRRPFVGWSDDASAPRVRAIETPMEDLELVAGYRGEQVEVAVALTGGQGDIAPGTFVTQPAAPDLWFMRGTPVTLEARATQGFRFLRWSGALAGQPNPATVVVSDPVQAGADFELIYRVSSTTVRIAAAEDPRLTLLPESGTAPFRWIVLQGTLPAGLYLGDAGELGGAAMDTGAFPLTVRVTDALGLQAQGSFTVQVDEPEIAVERLGEKFLLSGTPLTVHQLQFLDRRGNANGSYDIGDFRAWVLGHPGLPLTAALRALVGPRTVVIPTTPVGTPEEVRR